MDNEEITVLSTLNAQKTAVAQADETIIATQHKKRNDGYLVQITDINH